MAGQTVVVLGGGVGGLTAANSLRRRLGREHRVVLVDRTGEHLFAPSLLWLMVGQREPRQLVKDLRRMVEPGVEVLVSDVEAIEPEGKQIRSSGGDLGYDALVVSLGAELAPERMPGIAAGHNFFDLEGATAFREALARFEGGRAVVVVTGLPFKCPAAPYEAALLIEDALRRRGLRGRSEVAIYTPEPQPMPVAGPAMGEAVASLLAARGIHYHPNHAVETIDAERRELVIRGGERVPFDLLAAVPPHRPPKVVAASPLANEAGWVPVDRATLATRFDGVYAIGDVAAVTLANGRPLPKAGVFAHAEGLAVAETIAGRLLGARAAPARFSGEGYCWVELGGGQAAFATGEFYAEPNPVLRLQRPGRMWHLGKVLFERYWMGDGLGRALAAAGLSLGGRVFGVPAAL
ncbi:MAG: NAD(P)/FAD-dependent oxidoreductase [Chloroflexota bacterium]|nr:MAG: NAD(P)/FAD-dependent oxidoreductase [Chloroflexota bacterium]